MIPERVTAAHAAAPLVEGPVPIATAIAPDSATAAAADLDEVPRLAPALPVVPASRYPEAMPAMPPDLRRLQVGERVQDPVLVLDVDTRESARGAFTVLTLGNSTGRLASSPFWAEQADQIAGIAKGDVVQVIGEISQYQGKRQLRVTSIRPLPRELVDWSQLQPSIGDVAPFWARLDRWRAEMRRPRLRTMLDLFFCDDDFRRRFEQCPGSTVGHHAALGGLLRHVWEVAFIGRSIAKASGADEELVFAGALLHDIGKLEAYRWEGAFETTECGALLGHVSLGVMMLERRLARVEGDRPCTDTELMLLEHFILSHHGKLEFGAAIPPMTLEAEILHYADDASAKSSSMAEALRDSDNFAGDAMLSQRGVWQLDRRKVWRGESDWGMDA